MYIYVCVFSDTRAGYTLHLTKIFSSVFLYSFRNISKKNFYAFHQILGISENADICYVHVFL